MVVLTFKFISNFFVAQKLIAQHLVFRNNKANCIQPGGLLSIDIYNYDNQISDMIFEENIAVDLLQTFGKSADILLCVDKLVFRNNPVGGMI